MGTIKKGQLSGKVEYAKHLRKWGKRFFWKRERTAEKELLNTSTCLMCRKPKENDGHSCCEECGGIAF